MFLSLPPVLHDLKDLSCTLAPSMLSSLTAPGSALHPMPFCFHFWEESHCLSPLHFVVSFSEILINLGVLIWVNQIPNPQFWLLLVTLILSCKLQPLPALKQHFYFSSYKNDKIWLPAETTLPVRFFLDTLTLPLHNSKCHISLITTILSSVLVYPVSQYFQLCSAWILSSLSQNGVVMWVSPMSPVFLNASLSVLQSLPDDLT